MYYRLYRRRAYIYILVAFIVVYFLLTRSGDTNENLAKNSEKPLKNFPAANENGMKKKSRISMSNYVQPEPCKGCPGENGAAVYLSVKNCEKFKKLKS